MTIRLTPKTRGHWSIWIGPNWNVSNRRNYKKHTHDHGSNWNRTLWRLWRKDQSKEEDTTVHLTQAWIPNIIHGWLFVHFTFTVLYTAFVNSEIGKYSWYIQKHLKKYDLKCWSGCKIRRGENDDKGLNDKSKCPQNLSPFNALLWLNERAYNYQMLFLSSSSFAIEELKEAHLPFFFGLEHSPVSPTSQNKSQSFDRLSYCRHAIKYNLTALGFPKAHQTNRL